MPELPEVETVRRGLAPILGMTVTGTAADERSRVHDLDQTIGQTVSSLGRRGKLLIIRLDRSTLLAHLGMTGRLLLDPPEDAPHLRARIALAGAGARRTVGFVDPRRFGHLTVLPHHEAERFPLLARMGPEPYDMEAWELHQRLARRSGSIKGALLDQSIIAGVGNIYADESLWRARIPPEQPANLLTEDQLDRLLEEVRRSMTQATEAGGTTLRDHRQVDGTPGTNQRTLDAYGRAGEPCRRCGTALARSRVAGRGTVSCPACQTG